MSWLPNPFKSLQFSSNYEQRQEQPGNDGVSEGVKEEFTAIGESIGRQLRAFIAPETSNSGDDGCSSSRTFEGIRSDLEEIKGSFKSSLSLLSSNRAVSQISKLASNFLQFDDEHNHANHAINNDYDRNYDNYEDEEEEEYYVGINDEVIEFANQISKRPQLWTEFPLSLGDHELGMSEVQYDHASTIEQLVPSLADLRSQINDLSEKQFWTIYFILLLPRLNDEDLELLSTPEIVEARETLLTMLQAKRSKDINSENLVSDSSSDLDNEGQDIPKSKDSDALKGCTIKQDSDALKSKKGKGSNTKKILESEDGSSFTLNNPNQSNAKPETLIAGLVAEEHQAVDDWEKKEKSVSVGTSASAFKQFQSEDDVSLSDLEDDNDLSYRQSNSGPSLSTGTSSEESNDWVRLNKNVETRGIEVKGQSSLRERDSEGEDSTGWLTVDDFDP